VRFGIEAAFLLLVAGGAAWAKLNPLQIILLMLAACVLVALIERASSRAQELEAASRRALRAGIRSGGPTGGTPRTDPRSPAGA